MRKIKNVLALAVAVGAFMLTSTPAQATILSGTFTVAGLGDVRVGVTAIDFAETGDVFGPTNGDITYPGGTGDFSVLIATNGTIRDLNAATEPIETPLNFQNFITSDFQPTWNFVLTRILAGGSADSTCDDTPGTTCTPLGTPFTITNINADEAIVGISFRGYVTDGSGDPASPFTASFTTTVGNTGGEIIALILSQGFYQTSSAGRFTVTAGEIPEPGTYALMGSGLLALGMVARRRRK